MGVVVATAVGFVGFARLVGRVRRQSAACNILCTAAELSAAAQDLLRESKRDELTLAEIQLAYGPAMGNPRLRYGETYPERYRRGEPVVVILRDGSHLVYPDRAKRRGDSHRTFPPVLGKPTPVVAVLVVDVPRGVWLRVENARQLPRELIGGGENGAASAAGAPRPRGWIEVYDWESDRLLPGRRRFAAPEDLRQILVPTARAHGRLYVVLYDEPTQREWVSEPVAY